MRRSGPSGGGDEQYDLKLSQGAWGGAGGRGCLSDRRYLQRLRARSVVARHGCAARGRARVGDRKVSRRVGVDFLARVALGARGLRYLRQCAVAAGWAVGAVCWLPGGIFAMRVIYCAGGNRRFVEIALAAGMRYGARLPDTVYGDLYFADQNYHNPNREAYMSAVAEHRPLMASVIDIENMGQLAVALDWAEEIAQYVRQVMFVPKVDVIAQLPRSVGSADVVLGYSVPTNYGGTELPIWLFDGWPVHLLGGSPHMQLWLAGRVLSASSRGRGRYATRGIPGVSVFYPNQVVSVDGNMTNLMATRYCQFWRPGDAAYAKNRFWPELRECDGREWDTDAPYEAFRRSCENIMAAWIVDK